MSRTLLFILSTVLGTPLAANASSPELAALDPVLLELGKLAEQGEAWQQWAVSNGVRVEGGLVVIEVAAHGQRTPVGGTWPNEGPHLSERLAGVASHLETLEWIATGTAAYQRARIAPRQIREFQTALAREIPMASTSRWMPPVANNFGAVASEGPSAMRGVIMQELGTRGSGIKIAVFDLGFGGIDSTAAAECGAVSTHPNQPLFVLDLHPTTHGTACVEIIRDMAPDAEILVIDESDSTMPTSLAVSYAIAWGAHIISRSVSSAGYPGTGDACQAAQAAISAGVHFVNSAGNYANGKYWESGSYVIDSATDYVRLSGTETLNPLDPGFLHVLWFSYESPTAGHATYQVDLFADTGSGPQVVRSGTAPATDQIIQYGVVSSTPCFWGIRQVSAGTPGRLRVFSIHTEMQFFQAYGSVANPAALQGVISVGAVSASNYSGAALPEPYSSRGGGVFGLSVTLCAPTDCSTWTYGPVGFDGTSCSCPNFAAFLALHVSRPEYAADPLAFMRPIDIGPAGSDDDSGLGIIVMDHDAFEGDNSFGDATDLGNDSGASAGHTLKPANDVDWFEFNVLAPTDLTLRTTGVQGDTELTLYDSALMEIGYDDNGAGGLASLLTMRQLMAGIYYVKVSVPGQSSTAAYTLELQVGSGSGGPGGVTLLSPSNGASGELIPVALTWSAATGTPPVTYHIEVALDNGFANVVGGGTGVAVTAATVAGLAQGQTYWWRVRASDASGLGSWSSAWSFTTFQVAGGGGEDDGGGGDDDGGCHARPRTLPAPLLLILTAALSVVCARRRHASSGVRTTAC